MVIYSNVRINKKCYNCFTFSAFNAKLNFPIFLYMEEKNTFHIQNYSYFVESCLMSILKVCDLLHPTQNFITIPV